MIATPDIVRQNRIERAAAEGWFEAWEGATDKITELEGENKRLLDNWMSAEDENSSLASELARVSSENEQLKKRLAMAEDGWSYESAIVNRVWKALGIETYEQAQGRAIDEWVSELVEYKNNACEMCGRQMIGKPRRCPSCLWRRKEDEHAR